MTEGKRMIEVFYSYSHKDERYRNRLEIQLTLLKREGLISSWYDRKISAGKEWANEIDVHLNTAQIILLLVSPDFIASDYCYDIEVKRAMERHDAGNAHVIPIILRSCDWHYAPFSKLQALPTDGKAVTGPGWHNLDEAFYNVTKGIRIAIEQLRASQTPTNISNDTDKSFSLTNFVLEKPILQNLKLDKPFNSYKTRDEWIEYITSDLEEAVEREASLDFHAEDVEGHRQIRILRNQDTVYSLNIKKGGFGSDDKGISFAYTQGRTISSGSINAWGYFKWNAVKESVVLELHDISLLSSIGAGDAKEYTKEEFLQALWGKIRLILENSSSWQSSNIQPIIPIDTKQEHRVLTLLRHENAQNLKILDDFWSKVNYPHKDYPHHDAIQKYHRLAYNYLAPWTHLIWEKQTSLLPLVNEQIISLMYDLNYKLDQFVMLRNKMQDVFNTEENKQFWNNLIEWITAYFDGDINQRDEAQHGAWGRELDRKAIQFSNSLIPLWNEINTLYQNIHNLGNPIP